jgi:predicted dehydrogenase
VHIVDFATFPVGGVKAVNCTLKAFPKAPRNRIGEYRLDANDTAIIHAEFANGAIGSITATRWATGHANSLSLRIHGDRGALRVELDKDYNRIEVCSGRSVETAEWKSLPARAVPDNYRRFVTSIRTGKPAEPDFDRGAEVQKILEACFTSSLSGGWVKV